MSTPEELIQIVEAAGGRFRIVGDRVAIIPKSAAALVLEELRRHKDAIFVLISQRQQMPSGTRLVSWQLKPPPIQLSRHETVANVERFVHTTLRQLDAKLQNKPWAAGNWDLATLINRLEACGCFVALDEPERTTQ